MRTGGVPFVTMLFLLVSLVGSAQAKRTFSDNFGDGRESEFWGDGHGGHKVGTWEVTDKGYTATEMPDPDHDFPSAYSSLPFELEDFSFKVRINGVQDGGIWLRSARDDNSKLGRTGVVLITGGMGGTGTGLYWHVAANSGAPDYDGIFGRKDDLFSIGDDIDLRVEVKGDTYSAFINGADTPATTLDLSRDLPPGANFPSSGQVALFDSGSQAFDNIEVDEPDIAQAIPEPEPLALLLASAIIALGFGAYSRPRV